MHSRLLSLSGWRWNGTRSASAAPSTWPSTFQKCSPHPPEQDLNVGWTTTVLVSMLGSVCRPSPTTSAKDRQGLQWLAEGLLGPQLSSHTVTGEYKSNYNSAQTNPGQCLSCLHVQCYLFLCIVLLEVADAFFWRDPIGWAHLSHVHFRAFCSWCSRIWEHVCQFKLLNVMAQTHIKNKTDYHIFSYRHRSSTTACRTYEGQPFLLTKSLYPSEGGRMGMCVPSISPMIWGMWYAASNLKGEIRNQQQNLQHYVNSLGTVYYNNVM